MTPTIRWEEVGAGCWLGRITIDEREGRAEATPAVFEISVVPASESGYIVFVEHETEGDPSPKLFARTLAEAQAIGVTLARDFIRDWDDSFGVA